MVETREATNEELCSVHTQNHVEVMKAVSSKSYGKHQRKALASRYDSIFFNNSSSKSALLAAGSVIEVADQVAQGKLKAGAAIVRPPGHHAKADAAMGFCLFSNVAACTLRIIWSIDIWFVAPCIY
jgi:histone deacetylase 4/5